MDARRLVGWNLRRLRVEREMSIEALAGEGEVEPAYLGKVERGQVNSSLDVLARLASALRVELRELFQPFPPRAKPPPPLAHGPRPVRQSKPRRAR